MEVRISMYNMNEKVSSQPIKKADVMIPNFVTSTHYSSITGMATHCRRIPWDSLQRDMMGEVIHEALHLQP